jgi:hypothetical protein
VGEGISSNEDDGEVPGGDPQARKRGVGEVYGGEISEDCVGGGGDTLPLLYIRSFSVVGAFM